MQPLVSVIIPSFNSASLKECVQSVLSQTFEDFELIVVDCSTEAHCLQTLEELDHPKARVFRRLERHLPGDNRNFGIEQATGEYIICLDADDIIEPTFLEEALFVACCVNYDMIGTSIRCIGVMKKTVKLEAHPTIEQVVDGDAFVVTVLMRKELWQRLGGFRDHALGKEHIPEDWDFFVRAVASGASLYNRGSYGFHYRKHFDSLTAQPDMPTLQEMRDRIRERHSVLLEDKSKTEPAPPAIDKDGWRRLLSGGSRPETGLLVLPERVNDEFVESVKAAIGSHRAGLTILSTCQMESYPADFLAFLSSHNAEFFSLPDFLEDQALWLQFLPYLQESRKIVDIWYGQNCFFIDNLPAISTLLTGCPFHFISRYSTNPQLTKMHSPGRS